MMWASTPACREFLNETTDLPALIFRVVEHGVDDHAIAEVLSMQAFECFAIVRCHTPLRLMVNDQAKCPVFAELSHLNDVIRAQNAAELNAFAVALEQQ